MVGRALPSIYGKSVTRALYIEGAPLSKVECGGVQSVKLGPTALGFALGLAGGNEKFLAFILRYLSIGVGFDYALEAKEIGVRNTTAKDWLVKIEKTLPPAAQRSRTMGVRKTDWVRKDT